MSDKPKPKAEPKLAPQPAPQPTLADVMVELKDLRAYIRDLTSLVLNIQKQTHA